MKFAQMAIFVVLGSFIFSNFCSAAYREPKVEPEDEQEYVATLPTEKKQSEYASFDLPATPVSAPEQQQASSPQTFVFEPSPKVEPEDEQVYVAVKMLPIKLVNKSEVILYVKVKARESIKDTAPKIIFTGGINPGSEKNIGFPANKIFTLRVWKDKNDFDREDRNKSIYSMEDTAKEIADISELILYADRAESIEKTPEKEQSEYASFDVPTPGPPGQQQQSSSTSTQILKKQKVAEQLSKQPVQHSSSSTKILQKFLDQKTVETKAGVNKTVASKNVKQEQKSFSTQTLTAKQRTLLDKLDKFKDNFKEALAKSPEMALKVLKSYNKEYNLKEKDLNKIQYEVFKLKFNILDFALFYGKGDQFVEVVKYLIDKLKFSLSGYKEIDFETDPEELFNMSGSTLYLYNKLELKKYFESKKQDPNFKNFFKK